MTLFARLSLLFLGLSLAVAGCGKQDQAVHDLMAAVARPEQIGAVVAEATTVTLTARDAHGTIVAGLAQSWRVSRDGRSIVFRLRPAETADGIHVSEADVVASLNAARRPGAPFAGYLLGIEDISAPVASVVEIRLTTPQPELLELLSDPVFAIRIPGKAPFAVGPFKQTESIAPGVVRLTQNAHYAGTGTVPLTAAGFAVLPVKEAVREFSDGKLQLYYGNGLDGYDAARAGVKGQALVVERPRAAYTLLLNQRQPPFDDRRMRTALARAIDRVEIGANLYGNNESSPVHGLVPFGISGFSSLAPDWAAQPMVVRQDDARRLISEAGHDSMNKPLKVRIAIPDRPGAIRIGTEIATYFADIGLDVMLERFSETAHQKAVDEGRFMLALVEQRAPFDSPLPFLLPYRCGMNAFGACLPEADRLVEEAWNAPTFAERMAKLATAERLWAEDGTAIGLIQPLDWALVSANVRGYSPSPSGIHPLRYITVEADRKILR